MTEQFCQLTLPEAIAQYRMKSFNAKGLLYLYFKIKIAPGWTLKKTAKDICKELGIQKSSFYRAISQLKTDNLINWETPGDTKFSFTLPFHNMRNQSHEWENQSHEWENQSHRWENQSHRWENESSKSLLNKRFSDSLYSSSDSSSDFVSSGGRKHKHEPASLLDLDPDPDPETGNQPKNIGGESETIIGLPVQSENLIEDEYSAAPVEKNHILAVRGSGRIKIPNAIATAVCQQSPAEVLATRKAQLAGQRPPRPRPKYMYPDGEWLDNRGRLNRAFIDWMANDWKKSPAFCDKSIEQIRADVCSHFMSNHEKLAIRWDAYAAIAFRKMENLEQRARTGFKMTSVDAKEYSQIAGVRPGDVEEAATDFTPRSITEASPQLQRVLESTAKPISRAIAPSKASQNEENFSSEQLAANQQKLSQMISQGFRSIPAEPEPICKSNYRIVDSQVEVIPAVISDEERRQAQEMFAERANRKTAIQSESESTEAGIEKIKSTISQIKSRVPVAKPKNWATELSKQVSKIQSLLTTQQYQINEDGWFIDEEGEF